MKAWKKKKKKKNLCNPFMLPATWAIRFSLAAAISPQVFSLASQWKRLQLPHMPRGVTSKIIIHFIVFYSCAKNMAIFYEPWFDLKLLCFEQSCQSYLGLTQAFPKTSWNKIKIIYLQFMCTYWVGKLTFKSYRSERRSSFMKSCSKDKMSAWKRKG